jgi:hypothetical protein
LQTKRLGSFTFSACAAQEINNRENKMVRFMLTPEDKD